MEGTEPTLEPPGAGLPWHERLLIKHLILPGLSKKISREEAIAKFDEEGRAALKLAQELSDENLVRPVLIDRIRGIEDSSRNWSVAMTLHHLIIVGASIKKVVELLNRGTVLNRETRIQDVKPDPNTGPEILGKFEEWLDQHPDGLEDLPWPPDVKYPHPWFGPMNADAWLRLNAVHNGLHRKQIEKISAGL